MALLKTSICVSLVAFFAQVNLTGAIPTDSADIIPRQAVCAVIPGLSNPSQRRDLPSYLNTRQTANSQVSLATLIAQTTPCFPPTVDVSGISASSTAASTDGRAHATGWFSFLKDIWADVVDVFTVVADVESLLLWGDVTKIYQLAIDGYKLYTDVTKTIIEAKSLDGSTIVTFHTYKPPPPPRPPPSCGPGTGRWCPRS